MPWYTRTEQVVVPLFIVGAAKHPLTLLFEGTTSNERARGGDALEGSKWSEESALAPITQEEDGPAPGRNRLACNLHGSPAKANGALFFRPSLIQTGVNIVSIQMHLLA